MRSIAEIKESIAADFMANETLARAYGFAVGAEFTAEFSRVSLESTLMWVFASAAWVVESLFEAHRRDVEAALEERLPHRTRWYRARVLEFMKGRELVRDTDRYDTSGMTAEDIAAARVVRHATATENADASMLTIKVAGERGGERCPLPDDTASQLKAYIGEIKDAGVRVKLVNAAPDAFTCTLDVHYNPMLAKDEVREACEAAIKGYIENLPFNGEYTNMALIGALGRVEGVKVVEFRGAKATAAGASVATLIEGRYTPAAGYFRAESITIEMEAYV